VVSPVELRSTKQKAKSFLKTFIRRITDLARRGHLTYDDTSQVIAGVRRNLGLTRPGRRRRVVDRLSPSEADAFLRTAYLDERGPLLQTLFQSGARVSELVAIRVEDFRPEETSIIVRKGKGGKQRVVPVLPELARALQVHLKGRRSGFLFEGRGARAFSARRVQQIVAEVARKAKIKKRVHPHLLRHTVAQHLLEGGMPLDQVQKFLGHERLETTQIYAESTPAMIRKSYEKALLAELDDAWMPRKEAEKLLSKWKEDDDGKIQS